MANNRELSQFASFVEVGISSIGFTTSVGIGKTNPQFNLEGSGNMWIVKPGTKSRGRGIEVIRNFDDIIKHTIDN